jgi:hypothetical protein
VLVFTRLFQLTSNNSAGVGRIIGSSNLASTPIFYFTSE